MEKIDLTSINVKKSLEKAFSKEQLIRIVITRFGYQTVKNLREKTSLSLTRKNRMRKRQSVTWKQMSMTLTGALGSMLVLLSPLFSKESQEKKDFPVIDHVEVIMTEEEEKAYYLENLVAQINVLDSDLEQLTRQDHLVEEKDTSFDQQENPDVHQEEVSPESIDIRTLSSENENTSSNQSLNRYGFNPYMTTPEGIDYYVEVYSELFGIDQSALSKKIYDNYDAFLSNYPTPEAAVIEFASEIYRVRNWVNRKVANLTREQKEALLMHYGRIYDLSKDNIAECIAISRCENPRSDANNYGGQLDKDRKLICYPTIEIGAIRHIQCYIKHLNLAQNIEDPEIKEQMSVHGDLLGMNISYCTDNTPYTPIYDKSWNLLGYQKNSAPSNGYSSYWYQEVAKLKQDVLTQYPWLNSSSVDLLGTHR